MYLVNRCNTLWLFSFLFDKVTGTIVKSLVRDLFCESIKSQGFDRDFNFKKLLDTLFLSFPIFQDIVSCKKTLLKINYINMVRKDFTFSFKYLGKIYHWFFLCFYLVFLVPCALFLDDKKSLFPP